MNLSLGVLATSLLIAGTCGVDALARVADGSLRTQAEGTQAAKKQSADQPEGQDAQRRPATGERPAQGERPADGGGRRSEQMRWRPDGPMPKEMIERVIAVARDVSPELAQQVEDHCATKPEEMSQAMRQSARRLVALAVIKERNPELYAIRVEDVRLQLELRKLGDDYQAAVLSADTAKIAALDQQIAAKVRAQVDVDLKGRAQELLALDEQMQSMREELVQEQQRTSERVTARVEAVKSGQPIQERGSFGEGGLGGADRQGRPRPDGNDGEKGDKPGKTKPKTKPTV